MRAAKRGRRANHLDTLRAAVTKAENRVRVLERRAAAVLAPRPAQARAIELELGAERILLEATRRDLRLAEKNA